MWLLDLIPDDIKLLVIDAALIIGVLGTIVSFIFKSIPYVQIISAAILLVSSYAKGVSVESHSWQDKVNELQQKLTAAELASKETTVKIETQVVEHVKYIKEKTHAIDQKIQQNQSDINANCVVPDVARVLYNRAVNNEIPSGAGYSATTSSKTNTVR